MSFGNVLISQFYIKLDKKLIVDIENIEIKSKKSAVTSSYEDLKKNIELLPSILNIFEKIDIRRLKIDDNEFTISLNEEALYLDNKFINISAKLDFYSKEVVFNIYSLYLKDIDLMLIGKANVDYFEEKLDLVGNYYYENMTGNITLDMTKKIANFYIDSNEFKSLKFIKNFLNLPSLAESWMYDNIEGKIQLNELYGSFDLEKNQIIGKSLLGKAVIKDAKIQFNKNLSKVQAKQINLLFKNDTLSLNLIEPTYNKVKIDGSSVVINNLSSGKEGEVLVNIKAPKAKLDNKILKILTTYHINLPLIQKTGFMNASVNLKIPYSHDKKMDTKGKFILGKSDILLKNFEFHTNKATVILDNTKVKVLDADIKYKNMIDANVDFTIDLITSQAKGNALIKSFLIEDGKNEIVHIKNVKTPISFSFKDDVNIKLDALNTNIKIADYIYVDIEDFSPIFIYSKLLQDININSGKVYLKIKDENNISFSSVIRNLEFPIEQNNKKISSLEIKGFIKENYINVSSIDEKIKVEIKNNNVFLSLIDTDIIIDTTKSNSKEELPILNISVKNSKLKIDNNIYVLQNANAKIKADTITFEANVKDLDIPLQKEGKKVEKLALKGIYTKDFTTIETLDKKIKLKITGSNKLDIDINDYDILVNTKDEQKNSQIKDLNVEGIKSNIIINNEFKFLADKFSLRLRDQSKYFHLNYKKTDLTFKESEDKKINIFANDINDNFINTAFGKKILTGSDIQLLASGTQNSLEGKMILKNVKVEDLAILNNLLLFINTSPALINPFLAIPSVVGMATNGGFNLTGYRIIDGLLEFEYNKDKKLLDIKKILTVGNGIDFDGKGQVDINEAKVDLKVNLIFLKDYSKVVGAIPIVNYVLLGKDKRVETMVNIFGPLNNPKISTNLTKDAFSVPMNIAKRVLTSPSEFLDFLKSLGKDEKVNE